MTNFLMPTKPVSSSKNPFLTTPTTHLCHLALSISLCKHTQPVSLSRLLQVLIFAFVKLGDGFFLLCFQIMKPALLPRRFEDRSIKSRSENACMGDLERKSQQVIFGTKICTYFPTFSMVKIDQTWMWEVLNRLGIGK